MDDLIQWVLEYFGIDASEHSQLVTLIKMAILAAMLAAYRRCALAVGIASLQWTPVQTDVNTAIQLATQHAQSIVQTYQDELAQAVQGFAQSYESANGSLDGVEEPLAAMLSSWADARSAYKSEQIASYECGLGAELGVQAFVTDLASGALIDPETGEVLSGGDYAIAVLPAESSGDECAEYAGQLFDLQDADSLPEFPMHQNCPHYKTLVTL